MALVPFKKLFIGSEDIPDTKLLDKLFQTGDFSNQKLVGCRYPDGHVYLVEGQEVLVVLRIFKDEKIFRKLYLDACPDGKIQVKLIRKIKPYRGTRIPESFAVKTLVSWFDYDSFRHQLLVYQIERRAFETDEEFEDRRLDSAPIKVLPLDPANQLIFSIDSSSINRFTQDINVDSNLKA